MQEQLDRVAEAFSRKARVYDAFGEGHENLTRMRQIVYAHLASVVPAGGWVLEINAGTGLDAAALVALGYRVHATDLAPGMVTEIEAKIQRQRLQGRLTVQRCSFTELDQISGGPFDAVFSNFGGLNCIDDLTQVSRGLPGLLKTGGTVTWVLMPKISPWELVRLPKDRRTALRRLRPSGVQANVEGVHFHTYYFTARQVGRAFGPRFRRLRQQGLAIATPGADNNSFALDHPGWYRLLSWLDKKIASLPPFNGWGDFFILSMRYLGDTGSRG